MDDNIDQQEKFPPEENEFMEIHWGATPMGGDLSIGYYYDKNGEHCTRDKMHYMVIKIYEKDGTCIDTIVSAPFDE